MVKKIIIPASNTTKVVAFLEELSRRKAAIKKMLEAREVLRLGSGLKG